MIIACAVILHFHTSFVLLPLIASFDFAFSLPQWFLSSTHLIHCIAC